MVEPSFGPPWHIFCAFLIQNSSPEELLSRMHKALETCIRSDDAVTFLQLVDGFIENGGNPNLTFPQITIGRDVFLNLTCFQLVYLFWKRLGVKWMPEEWLPEIDAHFERTIDQMLSDERTDVRARFSEYFCFDSGHMFNKHGVAAFIAKHEQPVWIIDGSYDYDYNYVQHPVYSRLVYEAENYLLEKATIAHYAMIIGDFVTVDKLLQKDPDLLHLTCSLMKGKNLLGDGIVFLQEGEVNEMCSSRSEVDRALERINSAAGKIVPVSISVSPLLPPVLAPLPYRGDVLLNCHGNFSVDRITEVSLMHLAARTGSEAACWYLRGLRANFVARDSSNLTPFDYLNLSIRECFIKRTPAIKQLCKVLEPVVKLSRPFLPTLGVLLRREGYHLLYDTKTKVAIYAHERLTPESLKKKTVRSVGGSFKVDQEVPKLNRGKSKDYDKSGFDKGHVVPAADAVSSDQAMQETFLFTNACPQNPKFNQQYWKGLEGYVRQLANSHDLVEVVTGCLFLANDNKVSYPTIGKGRISVPTHLFKVLYLYKGLTKSERAYILPNAPIPSKTPYDNFLSTVDRVQELSGILFDEWRPKQKREENKGRLR